MRNKTIADHYRPLIIEVLDHIPSLYLRMLAINTANMDTESLRQDRVLIAQLKELVIKYEHLPSQLMVINKLSRLADVELCDFFIRLISSKQPAIRRSAVKALGMIDSDLARSALHDLYRAIRRDIRNSELGELIQSMTEQDLLKNKQVSFSFNRERKIEP